MDVFGAGFFAASLFRIPHGLAGAGDDAGASLLGTLGPCFLVFGLLCALTGVLGLVIGWKIYSKAGRPGWESLVPFYGQWILVTEICKMEPLWFFLSLIPFVNIVAAWKVCQELAKKFGKSEGFGMGLFFLSPIFAAMLAFGDARYQRKRSKKYEVVDEDEEEEEEEEEERPRKKKKRYDDED